jgi:hypothetical protein
VAVAVGEGLGEGVGVGEGFDDFGSWSPVFSRCLTIVFISACGADFFSTFFAPTFSVEFFSLFLFAASLSFGGGALRESPDVLPEVLPDVLVDALATSFSPDFRSVTLRGLVATCGGGFVFAVTGGGAGPVALAVVNTTGLSVGIVLGAGA